MNAVCDVLGEEGRKVRDACVKVKIIGEPEEARKYTRNDAVKRLRSCYAGENAAVALSKSKIDELLLPRKYDDKGQVKEKKTYNILDIHNALKNFDENPFVEKYPRPETGRDGLIKFIDKRRAEVEEEHAEAMKDRDSRREYSWLVAQRRVRDCFAGNFAGDNSDPVLNRYYKRNNNFVIFDIIKAVLDHKKNDRMSLSSQNIPPGPGSEELERSIEKSFSDLKKECEKPNKQIKQYSKDEAMKRVIDCFSDGFCQYVEKRTLVFQENSGTGEAYNIFDIYDKVEFLKHTYSYLKFEVTMWESVTKEYEAALKKLVSYSKDEAARRVRDCLIPGYLLIEDTEIFPDKDESGMPNAKQTYNISDIRNSIKYFDKRKFLDKYLPETKKYPGAKERNEKVKEEREKIREEYVKATQKVEIEHGSGFIINDHYVVTNKHVIDDADGKEIFISNASVGELFCRVAYTDSGKDLALLYCQGLDIKQTQVVPLHLSNQPLVTGMQVFSFGYPMSHTGETALFVNGHVSGFKETYSDYRPSLVVLNLSLNSGNSGGPILHWIGNQLKVVGVASQKHFKEILTLEEREKIEQIRKSMELNYISDISDEEITSLSPLNPSSIKRHFAASRHDPRQIPMNLLTLKLYDALETHSQFNLSNAVPGDSVIKFIEEAFKECEGKHKDELDEILKWSAGHNILPSDQHSASYCQIQ